VLAQRVNLVAKKAREAAGVGETVSPGTADSEDAIAQLERLAKLRASGALTEEEFAAEKQRILSR
jgi:hypothetical protein